MKTAIVALGLTLIVTTAYCQTEEEKIKATLTDMWDAIEHNDLDRYASHLHPSFTTFGETQPYLAESKDLEVRNIRNWMSQAKTVHTEMLDPNVTIQGDVGWITYYWSDYGQTGGERFSSQGKSTRIFVRNNDRWLCIHAHHTLVP